MNKKIVSAAAALVLVLGLSGCGDKEEVSAPTAPAPIVASEEVQEEQPVEEPEETLTPAQDNAVRKAETYLDLMGFSRDGLVDQLVFDKFEQADAEFAVDHLDVDWAEQAVKKGEEYLDLTPFSHDGLVDQLVYDKFTPEEAEHAATELGL